MSANDSTSAAGEQVDKVRWVPLESSPEAMNKMVYRLGVDQAAGFSDVWGLDDELLAMVAQPVRALVFLFPLCAKTRATRMEEAAAETNSVSPKVWFMRQTIGNACGTMAVLHALGNCQDTIPIAGDLAAFYAQTKDLSPSERAAALEANSAIADSHGASAAEGQTAAPSSDADVLHHYSAFVVVDGTLYELDGMLAAPINHGPSTDLLHDGARAIKKRIEALTDDEQTFAVIALGPAPEAE
ncbi:ubiquitinyl hydrolase 1 [Coemansia spiralis]|nr:ubiquitinyl hydrolase 1 [Coemansia spiralis]